MHYITSISIHFQMTFRNVKSAYLLFRVRFENICSIDYQSEIFYYQGCIYLHLLWSIFWSHTFCILDLPFYKLSQTTQNNNKYKCNPVH